MTIIINENCSENELPFLIKGVVKRDLKKFEVSSQKSNWASNRAESLNSLVQGIGNLGNLVTIVVLFKFIKLNIMSKV